nr:MAG TPA: hypothetical protein [Bacteriophage sp.]
MSLPLPTCHVCIIFRPKNNYIYKYDIPDSV